jgi:hypothetical protein
MNGVVLHTDTKWPGFPIYDAQVGTYGMSLVEMNPDSPYAIGQQVQFAVLATYGTTPWQDGFIANIVDTYITVTGSGTM